MLINITFLIFNEKGFFAIIKKMKNQFLRSLFTSSISIAPIILLVLIFSWTGLAPIGGTFNYLLLISGGLFLILGLTLFQIGASTGLSKVGEYMGSSLSKQSKLWVVILFAFLLGTLITCAEPSILIVAKDVSIPSWILLGGISIGVGIFVVIGILRILLHSNLKVWYIFLYLISFMLVALIDKGSYLPFIFDAGGITTGSATVPFILSLGAGIAIVASGKNATQDSFGLVGIASIGPIMTMTIIVLINQFSGGADWVYSVDSSSVILDNDPNLFKNFVTNLLPNGGPNGTLIEVAIALLPIIVIFVVYELIFIKLPKKQLLKLAIGFLYSYIGLVIFLTAVGAAMTPIGKHVGTMLAINLGDNKIVLIIIGFVIGMVTILCEPAVHVLTTQIENVSDGTIKKTTVLLTLSIGVGIAIGLAFFRSLYNIPIKVIIIPAYILVFVSMLFSSDIFTAIAFDSGGTASGPIAVSFVLPLVIGMVYQLDNNADIYEQAFGVVSFVALTPIIAIQLLGCKQKLSQYLKLRVMRKTIFDSDDAQIIHF